MLPPLLHPGGVYFNALGAVSLSSLVAGSVSLSKNLWDRFGRRSVFGDEADEAAQACAPARRAPRCGGRTRHTLRLTLSPHSRAQTVQLCGVDTSGYAILSHPTVRRAQGAGAQLACIAPRR